MHTLLIGNDNRIITTNAERIVRGTKLTNTVRFLILDDYRGVKMSECLAMLYYKSPISGEWRSRELTPSEELYKDKYVEYVFPTDIWLTKEAGDVEVEIRFYKVSMSGTINIDQYLRKATDGIIHISSSKDWASGIADPLLDTLDQRIIQLMMVQNRQDEMFEESQYSSASSLGVTDGKIHLVTSTGEQKGDAIDVVIPRVPDVNDDENDGMIEIDDSAPEDGSHEDGCDCGCDHGFVELDGNTNENVPETNEDNGFIEV